MLTSWVATSIWRKVFSEKIGMKSDYENDGNLQTAARVYLH